MNARSILTAGLAVFAACWASAGSDAKAPSERPAVPAAVQGVADTTEVVAYYFHGTVRCQRCLGIEKQARQVIDSRFPADIASGRLTFKALNYDKPENAHFLNDYKLPCPSLVLVRQKAGKDQDWKLLGQTWEMVQIPPALDHYIKEETRKFLDRHTSKPPASQMPAGSNAVTNIPPARSSVRTNIVALFELNDLSAEMNAVMVILPAKGADPSPSALAAINGAKTTLEARFEIKIGLFTLAPGTRDYDELVAHTPAPAVLAIVKTGVRRSVSGELTEGRIIEGFMAAVGAGGCCPLGYPGEEK